MILKGLPDEILPNGDAPRSYQDHHLYTSKIVRPYRLVEHYTGLGLICILKGKGNFTINGIPATLTEDSFIVVNRGSKLAADISQNHTVPVFIFFNTILSEIVSNSLFFKTPMLAVRYPHNFSLIEHIHYSHA
ncbi:MAG: hypothetical protein C0490_13455, partial [Marivirga sp.]|nr:hypothetical protein [Marivirga sp.]